jgi:hypothetical protein
MKNFEEFLKENWHDKPITFCGIKFVPRISGIFSEYFGDGYADKWIEIVWKNLGSGGTQFKEDFFEYSCILHKAQKKICDHSFACKGEAKEGMIEEAIEKLIDVSDIRMQELPKETQEYFHEKRGKRTGKRTGILESQDAKLVSKDRVISTLKKMGFKLIKKDELGFHHLTFSPKLDLKQSSSWKKIDIEVDVGKGKVIVEISGVDPSAPNSYYMTKFSLAKMLGKSISNFWLEFFEDLKDKIEVENFPPELQKKIVNRRGIKVGKHTGILESTNSTDFKDKMQNALERLGFQIEPSKRGNDIRRYTEKFGKDLFFTIEFNNLRLNRRNMIVFQRNKFEFQNKDAVRVIALALKEALTKSAYFNPHYIDPKLVTSDELPHTALKEVENVRGEITSKNTGIS